MERPRKTSNGTNHHHIGPKECFPPPSSGSVLHCDQLPESPARKDLYGAKTDREPNIFHDVRPKYLNSGSVIGPVGDMREYFRRVHERMQRGLVNGKTYTAIREYSARSLQNGKFGVVGCERISFLGRIRASM